jgi:hypothetical protein
MRRSSLAEHWIGNPPDPAATFDIFDPLPGALERMKSCLCQTGGPLKSDFANLGGSNRPRLRRPLKIPRRAAARSDYEFNG